MGTFLLWDLIGAEEQKLLRSLIKRKSWKPPSSNGSIRLEDLEEIAELMEEVPKGKQAVLTK